jgi:hypothetical protein
MSRTVQDQFFRKASLVASFFERDYRSTADAPMQSALTEIPSPNRKLPQSVFFCFVVKPKVKATSVAALRVDQITSDCAEQLKFPGSAAIPLKA